MTGDEMERAIEFLLQSQANSEVRLEKTDQQIRQTNQQLELTDQRVSVLVETQTEFIQAMLGHVEAQREINASLRRKTSSLARAQQTTEQKISDLAQVTERRMSELAQAQQQTQKDIADLTKTVGELAKTIYRNGRPKRPRGSNG